MKEKKLIKPSLLSVIIMAIILLVLAGLFYLLLKANSETDLLIGQLKTQLNEKNKKIDELTIQGNCDKEEMTNSYQIKSFSNIYDIITNTDSKTEKAKIIAKNIMDSVNNKDWYFLAKTIGDDTDNFIKYGITKYNIDLNGFKESDGKYVFNESYDWNKSKLSSLDEAKLGKKLIITFSKDDKISVNALSNDI